MLSIKECKRHRLKALVLSSAFKQPFRSSDIILFKTG